MPKSLGAGGAPRGCDIRRSFSLSGQTPLTEYLK